MLGRKPGPELTTCCTLKTRLLEKRPLRRRVTTVALAIARLGASSKETVQVLERRGFGGSG